MKVQPWLAVAGALVLGPVAPALAQEDSPTPSTEQKVEELDQKVRILERRAELAEEKAAEAAKTAGTVTAGKDGFSLRSADGAFQLKIRGYVQADGRFFLDDTDRPATDTFLLRRVRPIVEGTLWKNFDFRIMTDFGGGTSSVQDAYLEARFSPKLKLRAGKFKGPVGLERLQSGADLLFVERALPTNLVPNRDLGVQLSGDLASGAVQWTAGLFNGVVDGGSTDGDTTDDKELAARLFFQPWITQTAGPWKGLGFGLAATSGDNTGTIAAPALPTYRSNAQQSIFTYRSDTTAAGTTIADGARERLSAQLSWYNGPFGLMAEAVTSRQEVRRGDTRADLEHRSWQVSGSWVFGGTASYKGATVKTPFDPANGTWGAFELAVRYGQLSLDDDTFPIFANPASAVSEVSAFTVGFNWVLNKNVRFVLDYEQSSFEGGAARGDRPDEKALLSRFQVSF